MDKKMGYIYTMDCNSDTKENKLKPFAPTRMDPDIITLSEISKKRTDTIRCHLHVESET